MIGVTEKELEQDRKIILSFVKRRQGDVPWDAVRRTLKL